MSRFIRSLAVGSATLMWLAGCSTYITEQRPAWRAQAENACLARGIVQESASLRAFQEISGPGICGLTHPFKVTALAEGTVVFNSTATLGCPMIAALDTWIKEVVQPAAQARFGESVVRINSMGSYSCRGINNMSGAHLSEHAFGNAVDIGGFVLASGRELNVMRNFNGADEQARAFLHQVHAGACGHFTTVLGPGYNIFHYNHIHLDLAMHGSTSRGPRRYCKPVPQSSLPEPPKHDNLPDPPPIEEELDIARAPIPVPELGMGSPSLMASAPPLPTRRSAAYTPVPGRPVAAIAPAAGAEGPAAAPIISFADVEPAPSQPVIRTAHRRRPVAGVDSVAPTSAPEEDTGEASAPAGDRAADALPPAEAGPRSDEVVDGPAPASAATEAQPGSGRAAPPALSTEGGPPDWDVTSSVR